jgi:hypothetical protein
MKALLASPAFRERVHRSLVRCLIAVRRALDLAIVAGHPHPGAALRPNGIEEEDAADNYAVFEHVEVVVIPADRRAFEDQRRHGRFSDAARRLTQR